MAPPVCSARTVGAHRQKHGRLDDRLFLVATTFLYPALNPEKSARQFAGRLIEEVRRFSEAKVLVVTSWDETNSSWDNANVVRSIDFC